MQTAGAQRPGMQANVVEIEEGKNEGQGNRPPQ